MPPLLGHVRRVTDRIQHLEVHGHCAYKKQGTVTLTIDKLTIS
jgi:hypothetical protein